MKSKNRRMSVNIELDRSFREKPKGRLREAEKDDNEPRIEKMKRNLVENELNLIHKEKGTPLPSPRGTAPSVPKRTQVTPGEWNVSSSGVPSPQKRQKLRGTEKMMKTFDKRNKK